MSKDFFSPYWYRVAELSPNLRLHIQFHRYHYRGELWYVQQNKVTGQFSRMTPVAYHFIKMMNGKRTVRQLWELSMDRFGDEAPTQEEVIRLLSQLFVSDSMICDVPPDTREIFKRQQKTEKTQWKQKFLNPLSVRFPLWDPETFLNKTFNFIRPFWSWIGLGVWCLVVIAAIVLAAQNWSALTENVIDRILSAHNLLYLWIAYPLIKLFHELGHAYSVKRWGGEVHEIGIMFLVLMPVPYVDASAASAFREKWKRILVGLSGIFIEVFIASLALFVWLNIDSVIVKAISFNIIFIASVSTVLFNGNPLLRYDGYYAFSDLLEIPNLAQRGIQYVGYLINRYIFGINEITPPSLLSSGERFWLVGYTIASFCYRIFIYCAILLFITKKFFIIGILLGIWGGVMMVGLPLVKKTHYILFGKKLYRHRFRAVSATIVFIGIFTGFIFLVPFPSFTKAEGVIWASEDSMVRAGSHGFIQQLLVEPNSIVEKGELLILCQDPQLSAELKIRSALVKEMEARYDAFLQADHVQALIIQEEIKNAKEKLLRAKEQFEELEICSPKRGLFVLPHSQDLAGRFVRNGDLLGYILTYKNLTVRVVVKQDVVNLVRYQNHGVEIRMADYIEKEIPAVIQKEVPGAIEKLPSPVLSMQGGGDIVIDPFDQSGLKSYEKLFQFDLILDAPIDFVSVGGRAYIRFDHGLEPLAQQWFRDLRQLFLRHFNV
ncbi:MAG: hypothetical protein HF978_06240 [Desulfobacteraceae bacterium]|nr:hypothetical protein [Desulfobacteraceae bacterium]MBC2755133.1 hypothetical protein [Desulfobacteraceae bacterium]